MPTEISRAGRVNESKVRLLNSPYAVLPPPPYAQILATPLLALF